MIKTVNTNFKTTFQLMLVLLLGLVSCEKELEFNFENFQARLNVISEFSPENVWNVHVSPTSLINDHDAPTFLDNAIISITDLDLDVTFQMEHIDSGNYSAGLRKPKIGHEYFIRVSADGFETVSSFAYVPSRIEMAITSQETLLENGAISKRYNIEILDNVVEENYYIVQFEEIESQNDNPIVEPHDEPIYISSDSEILELKKDIRKDFDDIYIDESDFDGNKFSIEVNSDVLVENPDTGGDPYNEDSFVSYNVKIKAVSKDLFLYHKTIEAKQATDELNSNVQIHYNIANGTGIFGAYNQESRVIKF